MAYEVNAQHDDKTTVPEVPEAANASGEASAPPEPQVVEEHEALSKHTHEHEHHHDHDHHEHEHHHDHGAGEIRTQRPWYSLLGEDWWATIAGLLLVALLVFHVLHNIP